ncbi:dTDP-glucose 4,6-dehydratase [Lutibacter holmesii]|uniref:dTDP-glucose 4,6-dehydratase n=1 Tax=Lutibacter holmesii TaxID=1137985 RepID=A0ABW3WKM2_9FLAO
MKSILVTGGAGFIGANLVEHLIKTHENCKIVVIDALTYAGDVHNLNAVKNTKNFTFVHGNICDRGLIERVFQHYLITDVVHLAAESHVDNSISHPDVFIETNVKGTFTLLDVAYKYWMEKPFVFKSGFESSRFLHVSTDEVYGTLGETGLFIEETPYAPNSPYSASKASSDLIVRSYHHTYGMNTVITNCSNNYGPMQHDEKLIPTVIRKALAGEHIPIYGDGKNIRDWLFVLDHCKGIEAAFFKGKSGEVYNVGGGNERNNNYIANKICEILDTLAPLENKSYKSLISYVEDRAGHDFRYAIDATKIETNLGWKADENFESGILKTIQWYLKKYQK